MKRTFFLLLAGLFALPVAQAQTDMVWDDYGLGFTLPRGMRVIENDGEVFSAESDDLHLTIMPYADPTLTPDDMADFVVAMANELDYDRLTDADELALNDLYGYYLEGVKDGVKAVLIALMDEHSASNYIVVIVYTREARNKAIRLAQSFYAYD
jgi:hypothetical protein